MNSIEATIQSRRSLVIAVAAVAVLSACGGDEMPQLELPAGQLVETLVLGEPKPPPVRRFPGRVQASQRAVLAFQVAGPLIELPVKRGDIVEQGALLARLDPRDYENRLAESTANTEEAFKQFKRFETLLQSKTVSKDEFEAAEARYRIAAAEKLQAEKDLDDSYLRAPFAGLVAQRYVENFQNVQAKQQILLLENIAQLDVVVQVPEKEWASVKPDENVRGEELGTVSFQALPGKEFPVTMKEYQTQADLETQTYKVTVTLPAPEGARILPGMTAVAQPYPEQIKGERPFHAIPVTAIATGGDGKPYVWLVDRDSMTVKMQSVTVGPLSGSGIRVLEGLKTGDEVVTAGAHYLAEGSKIRLKDDAEVVQS